MLIFFSSKNRVKFGHFDIFSYIFLGKNVVPPTLKLTELLRLWAKIFWLLIKLYVNFYCWIPIVTYH